VRALNQVGLKRAEVPEVSRKALSCAFNFIFGGRNTRAAGIRTAQVECGDDPLVRELLDFLG
jgi:acyl-[acyl carrier protein]--UDP-N-acetylglucosamine O-acyltransferase